MESAIYVSTLAPHPARAQIWLRPWTSGLHVKSAMKIIALIFAESSIFIKKEGLFELEKVKKRMLSQMEVKTPRKSYFGRD